MKRIVTSDQAPAPGGAYSQGVLVGGFLFTAGVTPANPLTGRPVGSTIEEQTDQVMKNLGAILAAAGLDFSDVIRVTVHLGDIKRDFAGFNRTYARYFETDFPVRTTTGSSLLGILVEIDMIAAAR